MRNNTIPMYRAHETMCINIRISIKRDKKESLYKIQLNSFIRVSALEGMSQDISDVSSIYVFLLWRVNTPYPNETLLHFCGPSTFHGITNYKNTKPTYVASVKQLKICHSTKFTLWIRRVLYCCHLHMCYHYSTVPSYPLLDIIQHISCNSEIRGSVTGSKY